MDKGPALCLIILTLLSLCSLLVLGVPEPVWAP